MRKLKQKKGFTLVETLACIIVLLLVGGICTAGMNLAMNSYQTSVFESDSQMLESTLELYLCDILRHATDVYTEGEPEETEQTVVSFTNVAYKIYDGCIQVPEKTESGGGAFLVYESRNGYGNMVVGEKVYAQTLYISDFELKYNEEKGYFTGTYIIKSTVLEDAEKECTFTCRTIAVY